MEIGYEADVVCVGFGHRDSVVWRQKANVG